MHTPGPPIDIKPIIPPALSSVYDTWHFAPAVRVGALIFCSGVIGTGPGGAPPDSLESVESVASAAGASLSDLRGIDDPEAQFVTAFEVVAAVLAEAGATLADVVELTTYHVDLRTHIDTFVAVKDRYLTEPYPAWTAIGVSELIVPGGLVEIRAIAVQKPVNH